MRPSEALVIAHPGEWYPYLLNNRYDIPRRVLAKAALSAFKREEDEGDNYERNHLGFAAKCLTMAAVPPPPLRRRQGDHGQPEAGGWPNDLASESTPAASPSLDPKLNQLAQLQRVAEGN